MNRIPVEEFLSGLPTEAQVIAREFVAVARQRMRGAHEFIDHDAVGYSTSDSPFDRICYIAPQKKGYVNFGFFFGAGLPDPKELLLGDGKRLRHVKIWSMKEAKKPALAKSIAQTWKEAPRSISNVQRGARKAESE